MVGGELWWWIGLLKFRDGGTWGDSAQNKAHIFTRIDHVFVSVLPNLQIAASLLTTWQFLDRNPPLLSFGGS